jgi:aspartate kinase
MLEMAASGARVLQLRSVEYGRNYGVPINVRPSFDDGSGTLVAGEDLTMERPLVTAVTHSTDDARVTLTGVPDRPGVAGEIFSALAGADVNVDMIIQNEPVSADQRAELSFTVPRDDLRRAKAALENLGPDFDGGQVIADEQIGKVSIVGAGMRSHPGVAAKVFNVLGDEKINIDMISTSPIKISCAIAADRVPDAVKALHSAFELGADAVEPEGGPR